jgi:hypothetical protein
VTGNWTRVISGQTLNELSVGFVRQDGETGDLTPEVPTISISGLAFGFGVDFWHITFAEQPRSPQRADDEPERPCVPRGWRTAARAGQRRPHWGVELRSTAFSTSSTTSVSETRAVNHHRPVDDRARHYDERVGPVRQDNWKVGRPPLNLGLRYDLGTRRRRKGPGRIILGSGTMQQRVATAKVGAVDRIYDTDWNNVARASAAWDRSVTGGLSVRGGAGVSYAPHQQHGVHRRAPEPPLFASAGTNVLDPRVTRSSTRSGPTARPTRRSAAASTPTAASGARVARA